MVKAPSFRSLQLPLLLRMLLLAFLSINCVVARRKHPAVKMFILAGDGNVEGFASTSHLHQLVTAVTQNGSPAPYQHLWNATSNSWVVRDDVFVSYDHHRSENWTHGPLTVGGFGGDVNSFGPELQLGHLLGDIYDEPVVIVKTGWMGRSLAKDFAPPSSGKTGFQWHRMMASIHRTANSLHEILGPQYKYSTPSLGGFVWWHGYSDFKDAKMYKDYGDNLQHFLNDIKTEFKQPFLPLLVGELGGQGLATKDPKEQQFRSTQEQVLRERFFNDTTKFIPTAAYVKTKPAIKDYTLYYGNAATMLEISQAFAMALASLDYTKHKGDEGEWVVEEADIVVERYEIFTQFRDMIMVLIAVGGALVFVTIMRYGGHLELACHSARSTFRPSEGTGKPTNEAESDAAANNMEEDRR